MSKTVLITGASSGLGAELARCFAAHGHNVVLTARREDRLQALCEELQSRYHVQAIALPADLQKSEELNALVQAIEKRRLQIDILINNAGFGDYGLFAECDRDKQEAMIRLNVLALTSLTRAILPQMTARRRGRILNVASIASFAPGPFMAVYYATKAYVLSFSHALAAELKPYGITVTALCPGPIDTGFEKAANLEDSEMFERLPVANPAAVARYGYKITMLGKSVGVHGVHCKALAFGTRLLPRDVTARIIMSIQRGRHQR